MGAKIALASRRRDDGSSLNSVDEKAWKFHTDRSVCLRMKNLKKPDAAV